MGQMHVPEAVMGFCIDTLPHFVFLLLVACCSCVVSCVSCLPSSILEASSACLRWSPQLRFLHVYIVTSGCDHPCPTTFGCVLGVVPVRCLALFCSVLVFQIRQLQLGPQPDPVGQRHPENSGLFHNAGASRHSVSTQGS